MKKREYTTPEEKRQIMIAAGLMPLEDYKHKDSPWLSKCLKCGKEVSPRFGSIRLGQGGCKYCAGVFMDEKDAIEALEKAGFKALAPYPGSQLPWEAECRACGKVSAPSLTNIRSLNSGCKFCAAQLKADSRKPSQEAVLALMKKAKMEPLGNFSYENNKKAMACRCLVCSHTISPTYSSLRDGKGCPYCSMKRVDKTSAVKLMLQNGLEPLTPYSSSASPWLCKCMTCQREVTPSYSAVRGGQSGCAYCAGKKVDLQEALRLMRDKKLLPLVPYPGSANPWDSECLVCGKRTSPRLANLKNGHGGCLTCAGKLVEPADAERVMRQAGLEPMESYPGTHTPWRSKCLKCSREVTPTYGSVSRGSGCRYCAEIGIDYASPGYVYLITHSGMLSHKIGIANTNPRKKYYNRLTQHLSKGWQCVSRYEFSSAELAFRVEQDFLLWVRSDLGLGVYLSQHEMPQGGYTETFSGADPITPFAIKLQELADKYLRDQKSTE
jgi:recombinational DNA repair protein (RecF pathway)